jgi:hypothetical protein
MESLCGMPWPAECRYCDLITEDPDAYFVPTDLEADQWTGCVGSPSGMHEPMEWPDYLERAKRWTAHVMRLKRAV